jgi:hypothetical protein
MTKRTAIYSLIAGCLLLIVLGKPARGTRVCCEGDAWLKWSDDIRQTYVGAYILGFKKGYGLGCTSAMEMLPPSTQPGVENDPHHRCLQQEPAFPPDTASMKESITQFYQRYPNDRDLYIEEIVFAVAAGSKLEQIHERHHPPSARP